MLWNVFCFWYGNIDTFRINNQGAALRRQRMPDRFCNAFGIFNCCCWIYLQRRGALDRSKAGDLPNISLSRESLILLASIFSLLIVAYLCVGKQKPYGCPAD